MEITKKYKNLQLDLIHRDRENMEFSCVKFDILIFTRVSARTVHDFLIIYFIHTFSYT